MRSEVSIERELCIGSGNCVNFAPEIFELDDEGIAVARSGGVDAERARIAEEGCPTGAISLTDADD
jgi:ferredoxin